MWSKKYYVLKRTSETVVPLRSVVVKSGPERVRTMDDVFHRVGEPDGSGVDRRRGRVERRSGAHGVGGHNIEHGWKSP